jgi:hypothetical protein
MSGQHEPISRDRPIQRAAQNARWAELCDRYLPVRRADSMWRYSRESLPDDPEQGWKLHIPATVLTANHVLSAVAPLLSGRGVLYKAPSSLRELDKLNSGIFYGYSQVGKFLTVYPRTNEEAVLLARRLHLLTRRVPAPSVPFDLRYRPDGCVYYRYGAFKLMETEDADGQITHAVRDPDGNLIPDVRDCADARPVWADDPFVPERARVTKRSEQIESPLKTTFKAFRALAQRGRGGVYQALDLSVAPPRLCILKEGRKDGEVSWDGRDGRWRVRHEGHVLTLLRRAGINVPRVYASFKAEGNYYVAVEFIEGESLEKWLCSKRRRLPVAPALKRCVEIAGLLSRIHDAGWVWRDCKPGNIIVGRGGELRALDFEGACPVDRPDPLPWGTPCYTPPEVNAAFRGQSRLPEDLYALGANIYLLLAGRPPDAATHKPPRSLGRNVPDDARAVVEELLDPDPERRPGAQAVARRLEAVVSTLAARRPGRRATQCASLRRAARSANLAS